MVESATVLGLCGRWFYCSLLLNRFHSKENCTADRYVIKLIDAKDIFQSSCKLLCIHDKHRSFWHFLSLMHLSQLLECFFKGCFFLWFPNESFNFLLLIMQMAINWTIQSEVISSFTQKKKKTFMMSLFGYLILDYCPKEADNVLLSSTKLVESDRDSTVCSKRPKTLHS